MTPLTDGDLVLEPTSGSGTAAGPGTVLGFSVQQHGARLGTVALVASAAPGRKAAAEGSVRWNFHDATDTVTRGRAVDLALRHAFDAGWHRVEARVDETDLRSLRTAQMAGMRREGVARMTTGDRVVLARLATDPPAFSRESFGAILNAGLPRKRVIGQGLWRDESGRYLLCELTYKQQWDLPGGVIESGESPASGLVRELSEELGVTAQVHGLVTMNWLPAWRQWDDATLFVFDLGTLDSTAVQSMTLQRSEIAAVHWCTLDDARERATGATVELLEAYEAGVLEPYREAPLQPE